MAEKLVTPEDLKAVLKSAIESSPMFGGKTSTIGELRTFLGTVGSSTLLGISPLAPLGMTKRLVRRDTGASLAKEFGLRHIGSESGLEWFSMKLPKGGGIVETTIATKGVGREKLIQSMMRAEKTFATAKRPTRSVPRSQLDDPWKRVKKLLEGEEQRGEFYRKMMKEK